MTGVRASLKWPNDLLAGDGRKLAGILAESTGTAVVVGVGLNVSAFEATRAAKAARMEEIMETSGEKGETLNAEQTQEYDTLVDEVKSVDDHLVRLRVLEKTNIAKAIIIPNKIENPEDASRVRDPIWVTTRRREVEKGIGMVRFLKATVAANSNYFYAADLAKQNEQWAVETPEVEGALREMTKAAVAPGDTANPAWAGTLVQYQYLASEFAELLYPLTVIGRLRVCGACPSRSGCRVRRKRPACRGSVRAGPNRSPRSRSTRSLSTLLKSRESFRSQRSLFASAIRRRKPSCATR